MINLEHSMFHIIQYEPVYILTPEQLTSAYCGDRYVKTISGTFKYEFAYTYDFKDLESFLFAHDIYGGLVWDPKIYGEIETYFTVFLYYKLGDNRFRRINILGYKCPCGHIGKAISAYDQYATIGRQKTYFLDKIGQTIENETSTLCSKCEAVIHPVQNMYKQIETEHVI